MRPGATAAAQLQAGLQPRSLRMRLRLQGRGLYLRAFLRDESSAMDGAGGAGGLAERGVQKVEVMSKSSAYLGLQDRRRSVKIVRGGAP